LIDSMLKLSILTPIGSFYSSNQAIRSISIPSADGQLGILKGHCPLVTSFSTGLLSIQLEDPATENSPKHFALVDGFVKIHNDVVTVLCRFASDGVDLDSFDVLEKSHAELTKMSSEKNSITLRKLQKSAILVKLASRLA